LTHSEFSDPSEPKLIGEGGFSLVYSVKMAGGGKAALKVVPFTLEEVAEGDVGDDLPTASDVMAEIQLCMKLTENKAATGGIFPSLLKAAVIRGRLANYLVGKINEQIE
jgi:hypothetical protein